MSERFYDENELYDMQQHPSVQAIASAGPSRMSAAIQ